MSLINSMVVGMDWRKKLSKLLSEKGIKQKSLCDELGFHRGYIGQILKSGSNPSANNLEKICEALGITMADLYSNAPLDPVRSIHDLVPHLSKKELRNLELYVSRIGQNDEVT